MQASPTMLRNPSRFVPKVMVVMREVKKQFAASQLLCRTTISPHLLLFFCFSVCYVESYMEPSILVEEQQKPSLFFSPS
jgi:hypothetical protein